MRQKARDGWLLERNARFGICVLFCAQLLERLHGSGVQAELHTWTSDRWFTLGFVPFVEQNLRLITENANSTELS